MKCYDWQMVTGILELCMCHMVLRTANKLHGPQHNCRQTRFTVEHTPFPPSLGVIRYTATTKTLHLIDNCLG
jgi:hypothetical protein